MNNHVYTIEAEIHDGPYNNVKNWDYVGLIKSFNANDGRGLGLRATNGGELANAIKLAVANHDRPTLIECVIDRAPQKKLTMRASSEALSGGLGPK
jgi:indolepyruvate decarboxylase